jgi:hypothetical protein
MDMRHSIVISPLPTGWAVSHNGCEPLTFLSGAEAEAWARRLAQSLAGKGCRTEIEIILRDGAVGGRLRYDGSDGAARGLKREPELA